MDRFAARMGLVVALLAIGVGAGAEEVTALRGAPAPSALALSDARGNPLPLARFRGRVVLVNFWASWCPPCLREFPSLQALRTELDSRPFDILAVNVGEGPGTLQRFTSLDAAGIYLVMDREGAEAAAWQAEFYPTTYIVGPDGTLEYVVVGEADWTAQEQRARIEALMPDR